MKQPDNPASCPRHPLHLASARNHRPCGPGNPGHTQWGRLGPGQPRLRTPDLAYHSGGQALWRHSSATPQARPATQELLGKYLTSQNQKIWTVFLPIFKSLSGPGSEIGS